MNTLIICLTIIIVVSIGCYTIYKSNKLDVLDTTTIDDLKHFANKLSKAFYELNRKMDEINDKLTKN